ncbi:MAG: class IV adenylate cyclase [Acidobacteriia bacterium]|nr:class IV adenylate cyclase [Terriglobia bacterium]
MSKNEVEIKFVISDLRTLERKLRALGFRRVTPRTHEMNVLYDLPGSPLRRRGEILRLREYGGKWKLTHKSRGTAVRHKSRVEIETSVADGTQTDGILHALGFRPAFRYEKFRSEWTDGQGEVVLDHTPIGDLGEIEGTPRWIDATARRLGLSPRDYITDSYAAMFLKWKKRTRSKASDMTFRAVRSK